MIQFYFLSIFFNILAGYFLISGGDESTVELQVKFSLLSLKDETVKLILGILSLITALFKILSPIEGDVPVVGDLIPALAGFAAGFILVYEYYKGRAAEGEEERAGSFSTLLIRNKRIVGFVAIAAAGLHFLLPKVLFL